MISNGLVTQERVRTRHGFLGFVKNEIHELVVAFQRTDDCPQSVIFRQRRIDAHTPSLPPLNLTVICLSMYLLKSRMFSFRGFSV
jgi:hypothetical protein